MTIIELDFPRLANKSYCVFDNCGLHYTVDFIPVSSRVISQWIMSFLRTSRGLRLRSRATNRSSLPSSPSQNTKTRDWVTTPPTLTPTTPILATVKISLSPVGTSSQHFKCCVPASFRRKPPINRSVSFQPSLLSNTESIAPKDHELPHSLVA